jgi:ABC-type Na+ transport system ATPase subunit NatA
MKIQEVTYCNKALDWRFEPIEFGQLSLLVGISGVGKTQIIRGIADLKKVANGKSLNGVCWNISFVSSGLNYRWKGEFEVQDVEYFIDSDEDEDRYKVISEYVYKGNELLIERDGSYVKFKDREMPKLSPFKSMVEVLSEEDDISPIQQGFDRVFYRRPTDNVTTEIHVGIPYEVLSESYLNIKSLQESDLPTQVKLGLTYKCFPEVFNQIKYRFTNIFPQVEYIKLEPVKEKRLPFLAAGFPLLYIKEKGVDNWIFQKSISSGMYKTLMQITDLYLLPDNSLVLIDEFENSLGVNCIDVLTEDLLSDRRGMQFILTSHHPYIINNIDLTDWKIVTRKGGIVRVKDAEQLHLGRSKHQAFIQLMNLDEYREGIEIE